jgi:exosortase family protein XrtF
MGKDFWIEFKPTIYFLLKFISMYVVANLAYGWWVTTYEPAADPLTTAVTQQAAYSLRILGWDTHVYEYADQPTIAVVYQNKGIVSVYEGCNGANVILIFIAFLLAFGPYSKQLIWFAPMGIIAIYLCNLFRIDFLFYTAIYFPHALYFVHKFLFTAFIYAIVLLLWLAWIRYYAKR